MNNTAEVSCMFLELCYRKHVEELLLDNPKMYEKAMQVKKSIRPVMDWPCDTFATLDSEYNVLNDSIFDRLIKLTKENVLEFASLYGVSQERNLECKDAWINIAPPGAFQEMHLHPARHFSAVYYVETPENCGNLLFRSHESLSDMFPVPTDSVQTANNKTYWQKASAGTLLIFRSNMLHMVEKNKANTDRISVAMNFVFDL
jgi:uncharacterized protein (TIGR02466 family)